MTIRIPLGHSLARVSTGKHTHIVIKSPYLRRRLVSTQHMGGSQRNIPGDCPDAKGADRRQPSISNITGTLRVPFWRKLASRQFRRWLFVATVSCYVRYLSGWMATPRQESVALYETSLTCPPFSLSIIFTSAAEKCSIARNCSCCVLFSEWMSAFGEDELFFNLEKICNSSRPR